MPVDAWRTFIVIWVGLRDEVLVRDLPWCLLHSLQPFLFVFVFLLFVTLVNRAVDVVEIWTFKQLPVVFEKAQILFHLLYCDNKAPDYVLLHSFLVLTQVLLHLVESAHIFEVSSILFFFRGIGEPRFFVHLHGWLWGFTLATNSSRDPRNGRIVALLVHQRPVF